MKSGIWYFGINYRHRLDLARIAMQTAPKSWGVVKLKDEDEVSTAKAEVVSLLYKNDQALGFSISKWMPAEIKKKKQKKKQEPQNLHTEELGYKLVYCQCHISKLQMKVCEEFFDYYQKFFTKEPNLGFFFRSLLT